MNYFPFHIGDYAAHTSHLEPMGDLAYRRLLDLYYLREGALPADVMATAKLIRMRSMADDVESVLKEFFVLTEEGWRHTRCDEEISVMRDKQQKQRDKANKRWQKQTPEPGIATAPENNATAYATASKTDAVAMPPTPTPTPTPTPISPHTPPCVVAGGDGEGEAAAPPKNGHPPPGGDEVPVHVLAAKAMRKAGLSDANPGHAELQALARSGVPVDVFAAAATDAVGRGKGFAYAMKIVRSQLSAAAEVASLGRFSQAAASPLLPGAI